MCMWSDMQFRCPQGRHDAPISMKSVVQEHTKGSLLHGNFPLIGERVTLSFKTRKFRMRTRPAGFAATRHCLQFLVLNASIVVNYTRAKSRRTLLHGDWNFSDWNRTVQWMGRGRSENRRPPQDRIGSYEATNPSLYE